MITIIEKVSGKTIFENLYKRCWHSKHLMGIRDWCESHGYDALECHLQYVFPTGTDLDEYEEYLLENDKDILADLKGE
jgi:hypothetical protein